MKVRFYLFFGLLILFVTGCSLDQPGMGLNLVPYDFNFHQSDHGWTHGFSEYPAGPEDSAFFELQYAYTVNPDGDNSLMISGNNHSDDLFMFLKKKIDGLRPSTDYTLTYEIELLSEAAAGQVGAGGAPGESVFLKVGAASVEPKSVIENGNYIMNIDKGIQAESGEDMITIGNIATTENATGFTMIHRTNASSTIDKPLSARTNSKGELWLIVGTDSAFEGVTTLYYTRIKVVLSTNY